MKIELWVIGKTKHDTIKKEIDNLAKRIQKFNPFEVKTIPDIKNTKDAAQLKKKEAAAVLKILKPNDYLILLDERGKLFSSADWAKELETTFTRAQGRLIFLVGGAFGFDISLYERSHQKLALSKMTFSHQLIRLIFVEQIYRAFTIINNHPYHNN